jgi:6-pyruvoyltetrahydropterin/6-carboxytetrahydropterin synthase
MITATRYHDFSCGHRVYGHEGACAHLHGHNYRIHFSIRALQSLDSLGRVLDFSVIKTLLCDWLERHWDHRFLIFSEDPLATSLRTLDTSVVVVPFNPTAEQMGQYLLEIVAPPLLTPQGCELHTVTVEETRKCSATVTKGD